MNVKLIKALKVFLAVADSGSMSQAAKAMHMTVSAISQQLRKLEEDIGQQLFHRNSRNLSLTEAGRIYYKTSQSLVLTAEQGMQDIHALLMSPSGELKLIAPEGFGGGLLSEPLKRLLTSSNRISISVTLGEGHDDIVAKGADLALGLAPTDSDNFHSYLLATWQQCLCVSAEHPLAQQAITHPSQLSDYCYLAYEHVPVHEITGPGASAYSLRKPKLKVNSVQALSRFTLDGLGYAVLPRTEVKQALEKGELVELLPDWKLRDYQVYAIVSKHQAMPVKTRQAIELLETCFAQL